MRPFGAALMFAFGPLQWDGAGIDHHRAAQRRIRDHYLKTED
jgi:hypothetical protein